MRGLLQLLVWASCISVVDTCLQYTDCVSCIESNCIYLVYKRTSKCQAEYNFQDKIREVIFDVSHCPTQKSLPIQNKSTKDIPTSTQSPWLELTPTSEISLLHTTPRPVSNAIIMPDSITTPESIRTSESTKLAESTKTSNITTYAPSFAILASTPPSMNRSVSMRLTTESPFIYERLRNIRQKNRLDAKLQKRRALMRKIISSLCIGNDTITELSLSTKVPNDTKIKLQRWQSDGPLASQYLVCPPFTPFGKGLFRKTIKSFCNMQSAVKCFIKIEKPTKPKRAALPKWNRKNLMYNSVLCQLFKSC